MTGGLVFGLFFIALATGYGLAYLQFRFKYKSRAGSGGFTRKPYYQGLNHLLNDDPDAAIDSFISALDVNSETLETHLALANLLRKKGETAQAIRIHQNLLARPSLSKQQVHLAQLELAIDFLRSGLLDRAETLFKELADVSGLDKNIREKALSYLLEVYQDTKEWLPAIDVADRLTTQKFSTAPDKWRETQAQFSCELAEEALNQNELTEARRLVRNALRYDKGCVRASLLQAKIELQDDSPAVALAVLRKVPRQNPRFVSEALPLIYDSFHNLDSAVEMTALFRDIYNENKSLPALNYLAKAIAEEQGEDVVVDFLLHELPDFPQMEAAGELLEVVSNNTSQWVGFNYNTIKGVLEKLTHDKLQYECSDCGFRGEQLHWLCPKCKTWSTIAAR